MNIKEKRISVVTVLSVLLLSVLTAFSFVFPRAKAETAESSNVILYAYEDFASVGTVETSLTSVSYGGTFTIPETHNGKVFSGYDYEISFDPDFIVNITSDSGSRDVVFTISLTADSQYREDKEEWDRIGQSAQEVATIFSSLVELKAYYLTVVPEEVLALSGQSLDSYRGAVTIGNNMDGNTFTGYLFYSQGNNYDLYMEKEKYSSVEGYFLDNNKENVTVTVDVPGFDFASSLDFTESYGNIMLMLDSADYNCENLKQKGLEITFIYERIYSYVTFEYLSVAGWTETKPVKYFYGETPVFEDSLHLNYGVKFLGWDKEITPVKLAEPVKYTARYEFPKVKFWEVDGTYNEITLDYDFLPEEALYKSFAKSVNDIATTHVKIEDYEDFENRRDFWFVYQSDTAISHTIDTELTLEAISIKLKDKQNNYYTILDEYYTSASFSEKAGFWINCLNFAFTHPIKNLSMIFDPKNPGSWEPFVKTYYIDLYYEEPDNYELVYLYYFSADLEKGGSADFVYKEYEQSTLTLNFETNNEYLKSLIDGKTYEVKSGFTLEKGCYFLIEMKRVWTEGLGIVTTSQYDKEFAGTYAAVINSKFRVKNFAGEVEWNEQLASDAAQAMTIEIKLYVGEGENYEDNYTATIEFYDVQVYKERENTPGETAEGIIDKLQTFFGDAWKWVKIVFWVVVALIVVVIVVKVLRFLFGTNRRR